MMLEDVAEMGIDYQEPNRICTLEKEVIVKDNFSMSQTPRVWLIFLSMREQYQNYPYKS